MPVKILINWGRAIIILGTIIMYKMIMKSSALEGDSMLNNWVV